MSCTDTVTQTANNMLSNIGSYISKNISDSPADHTYTGRVIDKQTYKDTSNNATLIKRWLVTANGASYYVNVENANITSVGQEVRLYVPNNNKSRIYAEVINPATAPDKIIYKENNEDYNDYKGYGTNKKKGISADDVTIDTIVEEWQLADMTKLERLYILTVIKAGESNEEVTSIVCPDGKQIDLEGFIIG